MRRWILLSLPLLLVLAAGCPPILNIGDDDDDTGDPGDDDDTEPQAYVWVDPTELDFGVVQVPGQATGDVEVGNNGTGDLQIESIVFSNTQVFSLLNGSDFDVLLAPDETTTLEIGFEPLGDGEVSESMVVATTDPIAPEIVVQLNGTGVEN